MSHSHAVTTLAIGLCSLSAVAQEVQVLKQFGTTLADRAYGVAVDDSSVYVAGTTSGAFVGYTNAGLSDAFVRKMDKSGTEVWTRQFGTSGREDVWAVAVDDTGVYVAGATAGSFPGNTSSGVQDAFLAKYDLNGLALWIRQFGSFGNDRILAITTAGSAVYVAGSSTGTLQGQTALGQMDAFVKKYTTTGLELWTRQFGTALVDEAWGVATDESGVFVAGYTYGVLPSHTSLGGADAFIQRFDANGLAQWSRQFGTASDDLALDLSASDALYVLGTTSGAFPGHTPAGSGDVFVQKLAFSGVELWTRQFGTPASDVAWGVSAAAGGVVLTGTTSGSLPAVTNIGSTDVFVRHYDVDGNEKFTRGLGTSLTDEGLSVVQDKGVAFVAGSTSGALPGQTNVGGADVLFASIQLPTGPMQPPQEPPESPEPPTDDGPVVDKLAAQVIALSSPSGPLNKGQTQSLLAKIDQVRKAIEKGLPQVVCNVLQAFVHELFALEEAKVLTVDQTTALSATAQALARSNGCPMQ